MVEAVEGKEKSFSQFGAVEMQRVSQRAGQTRITDVPTGKRWLRPYPLDTAAIFDEWDEAFLGEVVLPTSATVVAHANAYNRAVDRTIIESAIGTNYTGDSGLDPDGAAWLANRATSAYVESGAAVNSGLTIAKLRQAKIHPRRNNEVRRRRTLSRLLGEATPGLAPISIGGRQLRLQRHQGAGRRQGGEVHGLHLQAGVEPDHAYRRPDRACGHACSGTSRASSSPTRAVRRTST